MVCQQFGGINGVGFYASSIFDLAGSNTYFSNRNSSFKV